VDAQETIRTAAERMEKEGVGLLVVVERGRPVGVLTDPRRRARGLDGARPASRRP
jgi:CBS domain-containing protein